MGRAISNIGLKNANSTSTDDEDVQWGQFPKGSHLHVPDLDLDTEIKASDYTSQMEALYYLLRGDNVVLCGQAGAGKSWVIDTYKKIITHFQPRLEKEGKEFNIATTASTGVAASLIMGQTIHSWSGLGISVDKFDPRKLDGKSKGAWVNAKRRIQQTDCLIIDEVSMLPAYFLSNLDRACKIARKKLDKPFGAWVNAKRRIQQTDCLIIDEVSMLPAYFLSNLDRACKIARKKLDKPFGGLQVVLVGDFLQLPPVDTHQKDSDGHDVDASYCFHAKDNTGKPIFGVSGFKWCYLDRVRRSKDDRLTDLLNGIRNENVSKQDLRNLRSRFGVKPEKGKSYTQLRTVNRSVDSYNEERLAKLHGNDQHYRVSWEGDAKKARELIKNAKMTDIDLKPGAVVMLTSNRAIQGDSQHVNGSMGTILECDPHYVRILFNDGQTRDVYRQADDITQIVVDEHVDEDTGETVVEELEETIATVKHLPIRLAWAITVHKSQGQTLDGAIIDLSKCFQKGLGYVALSRCKSLDDIIMEGSFEDLPVDALKIDDEALKADRKIRVQKGLGYVALSRCKSLDDIIMEGSFEDLPVDALKIDDEALKADRKIRAKAKRDREALMENEVRVHDLEAALNVASSKAAVARLRKQIDEAPGVDSIMGDDKSCYEFVRDHRARKLSAKKRSKQVWDNAGRGRKSPSGFGVDSIMGDDKSCYEFVRDHRARKLSAKKRSKQVWDNAGRGRKSPSGFGFHKSW